jgi:hypothetical protein
MIYRTVTRESAEDVISELDAGEDPDLCEYSTPSGDGDTVDLDVLDGVCRNWTKLSKTIKDVEILEHHVSSDMYVALRNLPLQVRDDAGFWRYVTLGPLRSLLLDRERVGRRKEAGGAGSNETDILACRMFLRGQVSQEVDARGAESFSLAWGPSGRSHDFWQSHVLRVPTGAQRELAQALIRSYANSRKGLETSPLRVFVRDFINRPKKLFAPELMDADEATSYVKAQRAAFDAAPASPAMPTRKGRKK